MVAVGHDVEIGLSPVDHEEGLARELSIQGFHARIFEDADFFRDGHACDNLTRSDLRKPLFLLSLAAGEHQRERRHDGGPEKGQRRHMPSDHLVNDRRIEKPQTHAAKIFRDQHSGDAQFAGARPQGPLNGMRVSGGKAHLVERRILFEKTADAVLQQALLFRQCKFHRMNSYFASFGSRGIPSPRSEIMFF